MTSCFQRIDTHAERESVVCALCTEVLSPREREELASLVTEYDRRRWHASRRETLVEAHA